MPGEPVQQRPPDRPQGSENPVTGAEDTLSALADFQAGLEHLKKLSSAQTLHQARVQAERIALEAREKELADRQQKLRESEDRAERKLRELEDDRAAVDRRREELESRRAELKRVKADLERRSREIEEARGKRLKELESLRDELEQKAADLQAREQELAAKGHAGESALREAQARETALATEKQEVDKLTEKLRASADALANEQALLRRQQEQAAQAAENARRELENKSREHEARARASDEKAAEAARALEDLAARQAELEQLRQTGEAMLAQARLDAQAAEAQRAELDKLREQFSREQADAERSRATAGAERARLEDERRALEQLGAELGAREQALSKTGASLDQAAGELLARAEKAEREAQEANARLAELEARVAANTGSSAGVSAELDAVRAELAGIRAERDALVARLQSIDQGQNTTDAEALARFQGEIARLTELVNEKDAALARASGPEAAEIENVVNQLKERLKAEATQRKAAQEEVSRLGAELTTTREDTLATTARLEHELESARRDVAAASESVGKQVADAQAAAREFAERATKAEAARRRAEERAAQAATAAGGPPPKPLRADRLVRARKLRRAKVAKIRRAEAVVAKRYEICEQVISQRAQLAATHQIVMEAQRRIQRTKAKAKVAAILFYATASLGVLAALSWAVAGQMAPGRYVATAILGAEGRGSALNGDQLMGWQQYHEKLIADPQFIDAVADHMGRKGIAHLASPGLLKERVQKDLTWESPTPGELRIELRGDGAERTTRELATFVTKLAWDAMATRERRADGALTIIRQEAKAGATPIDDQRIMAAGMYLGGSVCFGLFLSLLLWRRLANVKNQFERDEQIEAILDQARWPFPETAGKFEL